MKNTVFFQKKACPIAVRCLTSILYFFLFSLSSLAACVDKEPVDEEDADPAINPHSSYLEEEESGGNTSSGPAFPVLANYAPAFPGAVGYGRNADGARGSNNREIYVVTNLNNSGAGSLRDAVSQANRIVVFNVSGVIDLNKEVLVFKDNQTVLFQTAPGDGIELYNGRTSSTNANNLIVRYMRMRTGRQVSGSDNIDAGGAAYGHDQIYDHCSFTWGTDECFSLNNDKQPKGLYNITLQNSILGQGCQNHSCGGLVQTSDKEGVTVFRNLFIDNKTRNFKVKGLNQFVNNVIYNWGNGAAYNMGGESSGHSNTVIKGPAYTWVNTSYPIATTDKSMFDDETKYHYNGISSDNNNYLADTYQQVNPTKPFIGGNGDGDFDTYCVGNYYDNDKDGTLNGFEITQSNWQTYCSATPVFLSKPDSQHSEISIKTSATEAYHWIVENVGPVLPNRDLVDKFMIDELTSLGTKGTIFRNQNIETQYPLAKTWQNINVGTARKDTDGDGIPDDFEDKWGLNKNNAGDAVRIAENGYTMIENYAFSLEFPDEYEKAWKEAYGE